MAHTLQISRSADVPVLGAIPFGIPHISLPTIPGHMLPDVARSAAMLATLGAIDSLLTSLVADSLTGTFHDSDRELTGQARPLCLRALRQCSGAHHAPTVTNALPQRFQQLTS